LGIALSFGTSAPLLFEPESALAGEGPVVSVLPSSGSKAEVAQATLVTNQSDLASTTYHTVEEGESLWQIAEEHKADLGSLKAANSIAPDEVIKAGQVLRVPSIIDGVAGTNGSEQVHRLALSGNVRGSVGGDLTVVLGDQMPLGDDQEALPSELLEETLSSELDEEAVAKLDAEAVSDKSYELTAAALLEEEEEAAAVTAAIDTSPAEVSVAALPAELPDSMPLNAVEANPLEDLKASAAESVRPAPAVEDNLALQAAPTSVAENATAAQENQLSLSSPASPDDDWHNQAAQPAVVEEADAVDTQKSLAVAALDSEALEAEAVSDTSTPMSRTRSYQIKAGDTLWNIATRHGLSLDELMRHNSGQRPENLSVGDRVNIPATASDVGTLETASETSRSTLARAGQLQSEENRNAAIQDHLARIRAAANRDIDPEELKARIIAVRESLERAENAGSTTATALEYHTSANGGANPGSVRGLSQVNGQTERINQSLVARSSRAAQSEWTVTDAADNADATTLATAVSPDLVDPVDTAPVSTADPESLMAAAPMSPMRISAFSPAADGEVVTPGMPILPESGEFLPESSQSL
jgi:LysM repeat protein